MRRFLTTAIDYPNSTPHLGTAYEKVTADVIARWWRMAGDDVFFLMGNDEHSTKVAKRAADEGLTPLAWCDRMEQAFRERWSALDVSFDDFIRTSQPRHHVSVKKLLELVRKNHPDDIYEGEYEGWFCQGCEGFKTEKDLENGECKLHPGKKVDWLKERNWMFRLSRWQKQIEELLLKPDFLQPESRCNELLSFVREGLQDFSISRRGQSWGIPIPWDPQSVVYVWFDALTNYITGAGFGTDDARFAEWWAPKGNVLHVIGKDITRFHCVYWPAMLMSGGVPLPQRVFGHGWISFGGERMSKSLGNIVEPLDVVALHGPDPLRLYLIREVPYGGDGDFTWQRFEERYNADLANNYGNLVGRIATLAGRFFGGALPSTSETPLREKAEAAVKRAREAMNELALHDAAAAAFALIDATNLHLQETEPWKVAKTDAPRAGAILGASAEALRIATVLLHPVMPKTTAKVLERLGQPAAKISLEATRWGAGAAFKTVAGDPLFPRIEKKK